jgi:hypothetical protein
MSVSKIKQELREGWNEVPAAKVSLQLIDFICHLPADQRNMLTYATFLRAIGRRQIDQELLTAVGILANSRIAALDVHGMFVDEDFEHELTASELAAAQKSGKLVHPETGELIPDFEDKVFPFFTPSARFLDTK